MHYRHTVQTNVTVVGRGKDGSELRRWDEVTPDGIRSFEERYVYVQVKSGLFIGGVQVFEIKG